MLQRMLLIKYIAKVMNNLIFLREKTMVKCYFRDKRIFFTNFVRLMIIQGINTVRNRL